MSDSKKKPLRVAFQGVPGAYSELCIFEYFGALKPQPLPCASFDLAFEALMEGKADLAMLPVENSLGGTIYRNIDLLLRTNVHVIGEHNFRVRHCLLALPGTRKADIKTVISHPQALAQCEGYIKRLGAVAQNESDTAGSAEMIQQKKLAGYAAIASALAAETYQLEKLDEGIEDESNNWTRFLCLQRIPDDHRISQAGPSSLFAPSTPPSTMKTSIVFCLNGARMPGKLFKALSTFSLRDISITKIESRPMKATHSSIISGKSRRPLYYDFATLGGSSSPPARPSPSSSSSKPAKFQYVFYVDFLGGIEDRNVNNAMRHLGEVCSFLRVLGSYPESREMGKREGEEKASAAAKTPLPPSPRSGGLRPLRILIVGFGVFGQFLAKTFVRQGHRVMACSRGDYSSVATELGVRYVTTDKVSSIFAEGVDCVLVSVSITSFEKVLKALPWGALKNPEKVIVAEVLSVKIHPRTVMLETLSGQLDILCTHPMFGPESGKHGWRNLPFMFERVRVKEANRALCDRLIGIFASEGCLMYEMSCTTHDSYAASSQFVTHTTGRILSKLGLKSTPINTKGFESLLKLVETTCKDSFDLYQGLYKHNLHSKQQLKLLRTAFDEIERDLTTKGIEVRSNGESKVPSQTDVNPNVMRMKPSATIQIHALATALKEKGEEVISLAVGEPNDTKCPAPILAAAQKALSEGRTYYTSSSGMLELRREICLKLKRDNGLEYTPAQVVVSNGAKQSIMQLVTALVAPDDEVIIPAPYWTSYPDICRLAGCSPKIIRTEAKDGYLLSPSQLEAAITPNTRLLILCTPSNPTGSMYPKAALEALAAVLRKHPRIFVVSDEIYEYITYMGEEGLEHVSFASLDGMYARTAVINGFSKGFAMTGFRLGYVAAPLPVAKLCAKVQGQITSCACSISQHAGVAALRMGMGPVKEMLKDFRKKRQFVVDSLKSIKGVVCSKLVGAFYALPQISSYYGRAIPGTAGEKKTIISDSTAFCKYLLSKYKVALVPGAGFGDDRCVRISYAGDIEDLKKAMTRLKACLESLVVV